MARVKEPAHPLEKRELLHREPPDAGRIDAIAAMLIDSGRVGEAVEYVEVTRNPQLIARLAQLGLEQGSPFLLSQSERLSGEKHPSSAWEQVAAQAMAADRWYDAVRALQLGGDEERAEAVRLENCPGYEPFRPHGK